MKKRMFYIINIFLILSFHLIALNFTENKKLKKYLKRINYKERLYFMMYKMIVSLVITKKEQKYNFIQLLLLKFIIL